jgi:hypothetical protein
MREEKPLAGIDQVVLERFIKEQREMIHRAFDVRDGLGRKMP